MDMGYSDMKYAFFDFSSPYAHKPLCTMKTVS